MATKPGWRSTEFYLTALAMIVSLAFASGLLVEGSIYEKVAGFLASALAALGYSISRGLAKKNDGT